jgi:two-component system response regulator EvgA
MRPNWEICGEATDGDKAIQMAQEMTPDIILKDVTMPRLSGLEASSRIRNLGVSIPILIFTTHESDRLFAEVRDAGAQGYVLKSQAGKNLILAIDSILAGGTFFGAAVKPKAEEKPPKRGQSLFCGGHAFAY